MAKRLFNRTPRLKTGGRERAREPFEFRIGWRRRRDSNPRYALRAYNGLANRRLQPLGHISVRPICPRPDGLASGGCPCVAHERRIRGGSAPVAPAMMTTRAVLAPPG